MKKVLVTTLVILGLALVAAIVYCVDITKDKDALNTELKSVQSALASTQSELTSTNQTLASTQSELNSTKQMLASMLAELGSTQSELSDVKNNLASIQSNLEATEKALATTEAKLKLYEDTLGTKVFSGVQPPYKKPSSDYVKLNDNSTATNPTWQELKAFLLTDSTDRKIYFEHLFNCTNFAEMLHNNAEAAGIRAAFVAVSFEDNPIGHALNAFKTTDKGLVYVDCTGKGFLRPTNWDTVAYVEKDKEYGVIHIAKAGSLSYSFYEEYKQTWQEYDKLVNEVRQLDREVSEYKKLLKSYNDAVAEYARGYSEYHRLAYISLSQAQLYEALFFMELKLKREIFVTFETFEEMRKYLKQQGSALRERRAEMEDLEARLEERSQELDELQEELGDVWFEPLGIIKDISIHWGNN